MIINTINNNIINYLSIYNAFYYSIWIIIIKLFIFLYTKQIDLIFTLFLNFGKKLKKTKKKRKMIYAMINGHKSI